MADFVLQFFSSTEPWIAWNEISANFFFCSLYSSGFPRAHSMVLGLEEVSVSSKIISHGNIFCFYETCNYHALWKQILDYHKNYLNVLCQWHLRCSVHWISCSLPMKKKKRSCFISNSKWIFLFYGCFSYLWNILWPLGSTTLVRTG